MSYLLRPDYFEWSAGTIRVDTSRGEERGRTSFEPADEGPHRLLTRLRVPPEQLLDLYRLRIARLP